MGKAQSSIQLVSSPVWMLLDGNFGGTTLQVWEVANRHSGRETAV
jgi:hypothetical protein